MSGLKRTEGQVLRTVRYKPREERWNHATLTALQARKLVASVDLRRRRDGALSANKLWSITAAGILAYNEWRA